MQNASCGVSRRRGIDRLPVAVEHQHGCFVQHVIHFVSLSFWCSFFVV
jgi:hypothetical protein